jgi:valyl-tRNA synthetase
MPDPLPKQYDPHEAQRRWLELWSQRGYFASRPDPERKPFTIVIPPPNVTGALHLGHALNNTLQDVLIRWRRMQGFNCLWMPGTDHAGIATQAVVERRIREEEGKNRHETGREELVRRIWKWKDQYEARILGQLRDIGASADWSRVRFTLDAVCARAVRHTFFAMFRDGLIFRGKRLVNWDTQLQTSVADDETYNETIKGGFWTFRYPVSGTDEFIRFSTTRPETMLGDTAVAVHPSDERYKHLVGKMVTIPLNGRQIPIVADGLLVDPTLGTGAVKVTPAHDHNDYACGLRHKLPLINILNPDGTINENGGQFAGMDRFKAREAVTEAMEQLSFFEGREDRDIPLNFSDRSKTPIEPYLSEQWFVRMGETEGGPAKPGLAQIAMDAVSDGRVSFFPQRYAKQYLDWLGEKRDWCISRQLWWGHRIPIWYVRCPETVLKDKFANRLDVAWRRDEENGQWLVCAQEADLAADALGSGCVLQQDPDVLDTWFSSALWPHSTLGWPGPSLPDLPSGPGNPEWESMRYYYPTSVLITNRDIITLWVARMVITGIYNVGDIPFHHVYIHPKVLDGFGIGMSKMKGNGVDPLDIIETYGTDALRFGMVQIATETQDSRMPVANICPHCKTLVPVKQEHMYMRTKKLTCPSCKKPFRPGGPWPSEDPELPTARQGSERFEAGRNFANKLWNAARFLLLNLDGYKPEAIRLGELPIEDRWILSRLATTVATVTQNLEGYRFAEALSAIYDFTWSEFCDWYVEMSKGRLQRDDAGKLKDEAGGAAAQRVLVGVLDAVLKLVQPIMPFVAESIWHALAEVAPNRGLPNPAWAAESVTIAPWPALAEEWRDPAMEMRFERMQHLVRFKRRVRSEKQLDQKTPLNITTISEETIVRDFKELRPFIELLSGPGEFIAQTQGTAAGDSFAKSASVSYFHANFQAYVSLAGLIDVPAEIKRLEKQLAEKRKHLQGTEAKLGNASFVGKAPPEVVEQQRALVADLHGQINAMEENLRELNGNK